jgi:hypothetical protein
MQVALGAGEGGGMEMKTHGGGPNKSITAYEGRGGGGRGEQCLRNSPFLQHNLQPKGSDHKQQLWQRKMHHHDTRQLPLPTTHCPRT